MMTNKPAHRRPSACRPAILLIAIVCVLFVRNSNAQVEAIFWVEKAGDGEAAEWTIKRADRDGQNVIAVYEPKRENLAGVLYRLGPIAVNSDLGLLAFTENRNQHSTLILTLNLGGGIPDTITTSNVPFGGIMAMELDADRSQVLYVEDGDAIRPGIQMASIHDGLITGSLYDAEYVWTMDLAVDEVNDLLYWIRMGGSDDHPEGIFRSDLDGSHIDVVTERYAQTLALDIDHPKLYWSNRRTHSSEGDEGISRSNLDGSDVEQVVAGHSLVIGTEVVDGMLYWLDTEKNTIYRANADDLAANDGAGIETIYVSDHTIYRPAIVGHLVGMGSAPSIPSSSSNITVFPNPASDKATIIFEFEALRYITVSLFTMTGASVGDVFTGLVQNGQRIDVDLAHLASGAYVVRVRDEAGEAFIRIVVRR